MRNPDKALPFRDALPRFFPRFDPSAAGEQHPISRLCAHIEHLSQLRHERPSSGNELDAEIGKLCKLLDEAEAPYFVRYIVSRDILVAPECFAKWSKRVQGPGIELCYGGTQDQRFGAIEPYFTGEGSALDDVGCGKGFYLLRLASRYNRVIGFEAQGVERERAAKALAAAPVIASAFPESRPATCPLQNAIVMASIDTMTVPPIHFARPTCVSAWACSVNASPICGPML